jgi:hypothetical protein
MANDNEANGLITAYYIPLGQCHGFDSLRFFREIPQETYGKAIQAIERFAASGEGCKGTEFHEENQEHSRIIPWKFDGVKYLMREGGRFAGYAYIGVASNKHTPKGKKVRIIRLKVSDTERLRRLEQILQLA